MFESDYSQVPLDLVEKVKGIEARLRKASENGALVHEALGLLNGLLHFIYYAAEFAKLGDMEESKKSIENTEKQIKKSVSFLNKHGL